MRSLRAGRGSPLELGGLGYGAAAVGNLYQAMDDDAAARTLDAAWEAGIRYYDTAPHYGLGLSERRLGAMLRRHEREELIVSTKVGRLLVPDPAGADRRDDDLFEVPADHRRVWDFSARGVRRSLAESLERLGLDRVDILYLHDPEASDWDVDEAVDTGLAALADLRDQGVVRAIGVGTADLAVIERAVRSGLIDVVMLAGQYTVLDAPALERVVPLCREHGVGIVNVGVLASGLLASPVPQEDAHYRYGPVPVDKLAQARAIAARCAEHGVELPALALQHSLREPVVRSVVAGAASPEQVRENAARMAAPVPEELWVGLEREGLIAR